MTARRPLASCAAAILFAGIAFAGPGAFRAYAFRAVEDPVEERERSERSAGGGLAGSPAVLFEAKCSKCHNLSRSLGKPRSGEGWADVVGRMVGNGCRLTDPQAESIVGHLVKVRGLDPP